MWHETKDEMIEFLKSVVRIDEDQSARRVAQKYLGIVDPDYYEFEGKLLTRITKNLTASINIKLVIYQVEKSFAHNCHLILLRIRLC